MSAGVRLQLRAGAGEVEGMCENSCSTSGFILSGAPRLNLSALAEQFTDLLFCTVCFRKKKKDIVISL